MLRDAKRKLLSDLSRKIDDDRVIEAMRRVPREAFGPVKLRRKAYADTALPIGAGQTISQPLMVATMLAALAPRRMDKALEVGAGSGYQAALLGEMVRSVVTVERIASLAKGAKARLAALGYGNVTVHVAERRIGWVACAPYDCIVVAAAAPKLIDSLAEQLADRGRLVIPVGGRKQQRLLKVSRSGESYSVTTLSPCRFVPLIGEEAWGE